MVDRAPNNPTAKTAGQETAAPAAGPDRVINYESPPQAKRDKGTDLGWKIGGGFLGCVSGSALLVGIGQWIAADRAGHSASTSTMLQSEGAVLGICLAVGIWKASPRCRMIWIVIVTLAAIGIAYNLGPIAERTFQVGSVATYAFACFGPVAWLILLDRASTPRVVVGAVLVGAWHAAAFVLVKALT